MRQADVIPADGRRRDLRLKFEDFEHSASRHADPPNLARRMGPVDAEKQPHAGVRCVGDANEGAPEDLPVEPNSLVEIRHRDAAVAEGSSSHVSPLPGPKGPGLLFPTAGSKRTRPTRDPCLPPPRGPGLPEVRIPDMVRDPEC